jgi:hypothetical protein
VAAINADMHKKTKKQPLEGEGSYAGTRGYNKGLAAHVRSADVNGLAKKAAKALDGKEGESLRKAEKAGKAGPRGKATGKASRSASASR